MLSGGQTQKVAIARALINKPSILLADEPTGNLDTESGNTIMKLLSKIHRKGNTILMVTHNPDLTLYADRVIYLRDGQIQYDQELRKNEVVDMRDFALPKQQKKTARKTTRTTRKPKAKKT